MARRLAGVLRHNIHTVQNLVMNIRFNVTDMLFHDPRPA